MPKNIGTSNGNWRGAEMREYLRTVTEATTSRNDERKAAVKAATTCKCGGRKDVWETTCRNCRDNHKNAHDFGARMTISGGEIVELDQPAVTADDTEIPF